MLEFVDGGLESLLRASVPLSATDIDVAFEAPDREWSSRLSRPTVNCFLWDLRRSATKSKGGLQTVIRDGVRVHQPAFPVIELRYVITAWTADHRDERSLLSGLLRSLLATSSIPHSHLDASMHHLDTPQLELAKSGEDHMDVFKALEGKVKPGLNIVITTELDSGVFDPAGPPVESIGLATTRLDDADAHTSSRRRVAGEVVDAAARGVVGATVRTPHGSGVVSESGRFLVPAATGDTLVIDVEPELSVVIAESGGVRIE